MEYSEGVGKTASVTGRGSILCDVIYECPLSLFRNLNQVCFNFKDQMFTLYAIFIYTKLIFNYTPSRINVTDKVLRLRKRKMTKH